MPRPSPIRPAGLAFALAVLAAGLPPTPARAEKLAPAAARLKADVSFLADDAREGRSPGTKGIEQAADYIAREFEKIGLKPAPGADGYFQPFEVREPKLADNAKATLDGPDGKAVELKPEEQFSSLGSRGGTITDAPVVFAGYGITAKDEKLGLDYDDYAGIDAKGKVVLVLRGEPQQEKGDSPFDGKKTTEYASFFRKARNAEEHGAAALLVVNSLGSLKGEQDGLEPDAIAGRLAVPTLMITRDAADQLLKAAGLEGVTELEKDIDADLKPISKPLEGWSLNAVVAIEPKGIATRNVVGVLEGSGPTAEETIVVGAHYDHVGRGGRGSLAPGSREIHNGADDNASGTAMVIEMARRLAARPDPLPRRIVFMAFSGEERGLLGSAYYVAHPLYPLAETVAMLNFDMVGRLNDKRELTIYGAGTVAGLPDLVAALAKSQGIDARVVEGTGGEFGASDHASFYRKDIPVLFAFTGNHPQYHRPTDDTDLINFDGMARIADLAELVLLDLDRRPERPEFVKLKSRARSSVGGVSGAGAYMGTQPSYGEPDEPGVKLDGVTEGSPAEKAGIKGGDVIVGFDGKPVEDIQGFMEGLSTKKPGDEVEVVVKRDGKEQTLKVTLGSRPAPR